MSWPTRALGELVDIKTGKLDANASVEGGMYPFFTCSRNALAIDIPAFDADAILIAGNGDLNVKHYKGKFNAYQRTYVVTVNNVEKLDSRYLFYFMDKYVERLRELSIGGVIKYIKLGMLADASIPLPPLAEQKRIAAILNKADAIRRKRQQAIELADEFLRAVFLDMFGDPVTNPKGWEEKALLSLVVGKFQNGAYFPKEEYSDEGVEMVHMADAFYDVINRGSLKRVLAGDADIAKYGLTYEDLMISRRSLNYEGAAKPSLIPNSDEPLIFESSMIRITPDKSQVDIRYLFQYLSDPLVKDHFIRKFVTGATIKGISQKNLEQVRILVPPVELQKKFTAIAGKLEVSSTKLKVSEENTVDIFNGLSQKAFSGQL